MLSCYILQNVWKSYLCIIPLMSVYMIRDVNLEFVFTSYQLFGVHMAFYATVCYIYGLFIPFPVLFISLRNIQYFGKYLVLFYFV